MPYSDFAFCVVVSNVKEKEAEHPSGEDFHLLSPTRVNKGKWIYDGGLRLRGAMSGLSWAFWGEFSPTLEGLNPSFLPALLGEVRKQAREEFFERRGMDPTKA